MKHFVLCALMKTTPHYDPIIILFPYQCLDLNITSKRQHSTVSINDRSFLVLSNTAVTSSIPNACNASVCPQCPAAVSTNIYTFAWCHIQIVFIDSHVETNQVSVLPALIY